MKDIRKYAYIALASLKDASFYRGKLITSVFIWLFRVGVLMALYYYAFQYVGSNVNGVNYTTAVWSIAIYFVMLSFGSRRVHRTIMTDIRSGNVEVKINKPFNYLLYKYSEHLGKGILDFIITFIVTIIFLTIIAGVPVVSINLLWVISTLILFIGGIILAYLIYGIVGMASFWIENSDPVFWIVDKSVLILGGSYIPVAMFPDSIKLISETTPFGAIMFITQILNSDFMSKALTLIVIQIVWILMFLFLTIKLFNRAVLKLSVNGG